MTRKTHSKNRFPVRLKKYTHKILVLQSKSGQKLLMKVMVSVIIDQLDEFKLVKPFNKFRLADLEAVFIKERVGEDGSEWNTVYVDSEDTIKKLEAYSDKSGISKWLIMDHLIRLVRDLKIFSADRKGRNRIRAAIERRGKSKVKKIHYVEVEPVDELPVESGRQRPALKVGARNRVYPLRSFKPIPIRLELSIENIKVSIRRTLDNFYRWTPFNANETRVFLNKIEMNRNPVSLEVLEKEVIDPLGQNHLIRKYVSPGRYGNVLSIETSKEFYAAIGKEWSCPPWIQVMRQLIELFEMSKNYRAIKKMYYSNKMWFEKYGVEVPDTYRGHENEIVSTSKEFKRLGIAEALDLKIKELLKIDDEFEYAVAHYEELDVWERKLIESKVRWAFKDHEYAQLLREKFKVRQSSDQLG